MASPWTDRVDDGMLAQCDDGGAGDERHVGQLDAVALLVLVLFLLAQLDDARHVHLEDGVDMRAGALGFDHALRDDGAHLRHWNELAGHRRSGQRAWPEWQQRLQLVLQLQASDRCFEMSDDVALRDAAG